MCNIGKVRVVLTITSDVDQSLKELERLECQIIARHANGSDTDFVIEAPAESLIFLNNLPGLTEIFVDYLRPMTFY